MKEIVSGSLCGVLAAFLFIAGCKTSPTPIPPEITTVPPTTLAQAVEPMLASALLTTEETTNILHATNNLTEENPQFAFQIWSISSVQSLTDTPVPSLLVTHRDGSITIFALAGWDQVRDIGNGYDIWYRGEAVTCSVYTAKTGQVVRVNSRKVYGSNDHDELLDYVMKFVPPMPVPEMGEVPVVIMDPRVEKGIVRGPLYGNVASAWNWWAKELGRAER